MNTFKNYVNNLTKKQIRKISKYYVCDCELAWHITIHTNSKGQSYTTKKLDHFIYNCEGIRKKEIELITNNTELRDYIINFISSKLNNNLFKNIILIGILSILAIGILITFFLYKNKSLKIFLLIVFLFIIVFTIISFISQIMNTKLLLNNINLIMFLSSNAVLNDSNKIEICSFILEY